MQLSLSFPERHGLMILFTEVKVGPRSFLNCIKDALTALEIKKEEIAEYGLSDRDGGGINWNKELAKKEKLFVITDGAYNYAKKTLKDREEQLHIDLLAIANKILSEINESGSDKPLTDAL